jgi:hypothetical protein
VLRDDARVYRSLAELRTAFHEVRLEPGAVDFSREKLVRVSWSASGYYTGQMWRRDRDAGPLFGELTFDASRGGSAVSFRVSQPAPGGGLALKMHSVFQKRTGVNWFAVPKHATVRYGEADPAAPVFGLVFVVSLGLIVATCFAPWTRTGGATRGHGHEAERFDATEPPSEPVTTPAEN